MAALQRLIIFLIIIIYAVLYAGAAHLEAVQVGQHPSPSQKPLSVSTTQPPVVVVSGKRVQHDRGADRSKPQKV